MGLNMMLLLLLLLSLLLLLLHFFESYVSLKDFLQKPAKVDETTSFRYAGHT